MRKYIFLFVFLFPSFSSADSLAAGTLSSRQLQKYCHELRKGLSGQPFIKDKAVFCKTYISSFLDNMIIVNGLTKQQQFCLPEKFSVSKHTRILDSWVLSNQKIADRTTASVALFSALKKTFPCN